MQSENRPLRKMVTSIELTRTARLTSHVLA